MNVHLVTVELAALMAPPSLEAVLFLNILLVIVAVFAVIPSPRFAALMIKVQLIRKSWSLFKR